MITLARFLIASIALVWLPVHASAPHHMSSFHLLSAADRRQAAVASRLAVRNARSAAAWLRRQRGVARVQLEPDGKTLDVHFRDGAELVIVPRARHTTPLSLPHGLQPHRTAFAPSPAAGKAVVLEPFATELGLGPNAGQPESDALSKAGYQVDTFRNSDVTVPIMEKLASYSVVYMETHSGPLVNPDGSVDALVLTGETTTAPYKTLFQEGSVLQGMAAGDNLHLYIGIRAKFITAHVGVFPDSSIVYLSGCDILGAPLFEQALLGRNASTLVSWDNKVDSGISEQAAQVAFASLATGMSVTQSIEATRKAGLGTSIYVDPQAGTIITAHLDYVGNGDDTLARALDGATATPVPSPSPTEVPTATPVPTKAPAKPLKCKKGYKLVHGKCKKSAPPKCKKGYKLQHGKCVKQKKH